MTIGESIKYYRKQNKLTQKQLAKLCNLAEITIRQYEADKYVPKIGNLQKISAVLNIPLTKLMEVNGEVPWADLATDYPDSPVIQRGENLSVAFLTSEETGYIEQITFSLGRLNLKGLQAINSYLIEISSNTEYLKSPTTE